MSQRGEGQLQELSERLQALDSLEAQLETQMTALRTEQSAVREAINALDALETDSSVQVPLGGGAFVRARIEDVDEVIVELGGNFAVEQTREEATGTLDRKIDSIDEQIEELQSELADVQSDIQEVEGRAQQLQQQLVQQRMQQLQGEGRGQLGGQGGQGE